MEIAVPTHYEALMSDLAFRNARMRAIRLSRT
jgi:hypothetical protein